MVCAAGRAAVVSHWVGGHIDVAAADTDFDDGEKRDRRGISYHFVPASAVTVSMAV